MDEQPYWLHDDEDGNEAVHVYLARGRRSLQDFADHNCSLPQAALFPQNDATESEQCLTLPPN